MQTKHRVLIVDDDSSIRWVLSRAIQNAGFKVISCDNGQEALTLISQQQPSVVFSDIQMPGISGLELLETIRNRHPQLPVVMITANPDTDMASRSHQIGAFDYLPKPFDLNQAVQICERAIHKVQPQSELTPWQEQIRNTIMAEYHQGNNQVLEQLQQEFEQFLVDNALQLSQGHKQKASKLLGWGRNTLTRKLQQWDKTSTTESKD